ncbi:MULTISPECIES: hypothetical protein [unclassified Kitasatospora]|uniref:hypothetical protein n=1 Tax=unclassified Kitasatospora TaxID=2633591 RepID=UPI003406FC16
MSEKQRPLLRYRPAGPLVLGGLGWACSVPTVLADDEIHGLVSRCHDSPGAPAHVLPLAWVGLVLGIGAVCWGGRQLVTAAGRKARRLGPGLGLGHALLCVLLPVAAIGVPLQYALAQTAAHDTGAQRSTCFGQGRLAGAAGPAAVRQVRLRA